MQFRQATYDDLSAIMTLITQARAHLKALGVDQWQDEYPAKSHITGDLDAGEGYVMHQDGALTGYACVSFAGEPAYDTLQGQWHSAGPYAVVHRMAIGDGHKGKGLSTLFFDYVQTLCRQRGVHTIKVDTDRDNATMRHILDKNGFSYRGEIRFQNSDKIAFEKTLSAAPDHA